MFRVHAQAEREVNGFVEFRLGKFGEDANGTSSAFLYRLLGICFGAVQANP
jgi:hypothetical protein